MDIRTFINAYLGNFDLITLMEYAGDYSTPAADLDEDYIKLGDYKGLNDIPELNLMQKVEYFNIIQDGDKTQIIIFMEA